MNNKIKTIIAILLFAAFLTGAYFAFIYLSKTVDSPDNPAGKQDETAQSGEQRNEEKAPDFTVFDAGDNEIKLSELFGKPIVLNIWASWCPPCKAELPDFNNVYEEMGETVTFMMVDLVDGSRETKQTGEKYIAEQGFTFPVYYDTKQEAGLVYSVTSIPTTVFIDKDGYIIKKLIGQIDEKTLRDGIDLILN